MPRLHPPRLRLGLSALAVLIEVAGFGAITFGAWLVYHPAAPMLGGAFAVLLAQGIETDGSASPRA
jgi:hypothetical protein